MAAWPQARSFLPFPSLSKYRSRISNILARVAYPFRLFCPSLHNRVAHRFLRRRRLLWPSSKSVGFPCTLPQLTTRAAAVTVKARTRRQRRFCLARVPALLTGRPALRAAKGNNKNSNSSPPKSLPWETERSEGVERASAQPAQRVTKPEIIASRVAHPFRFFFPSPHNWVAMLFAQTPRSLRRQAKAWGSHVLSLS